MNPAARLCAALLIGLVLWLPTLTATLRGDVDIVEAAIRYLVGFVLARIAVGGLAALIRSYSAPDGDAVAGMGEHQFESAASHPPVAGTS